MENKYSKDYTTQELMVAAAAREINDGEVVFVGIGLPVLATLLAQRTHAPNLVMIYEAGVVGAKPARLALSIGDPTLFSGALMALDFHDVFAMFLQRGLCDVSFMSGAQIDKYGNINATVIGDYNKPKVRLPGSGGAYDLGTSKKMLIIARHEKRRFVEKVDFITTVGYLSGKDSRQKAGIKGGGPSAVITNLGILRFEKESKEMYLETYHPGVTVQQVKDNTSWNLKISPRIFETKPPTQEEVMLLRNELDPNGIFLK